MKLEIIGTERKYGRRLIRFDGRDVWLRAKAFRFMVLMAAARLTTDWWVPVNDFEVSYYVARNMYRLKRELKKQGVRDMIKNSKGTGQGLGFYRLSGDLEISFDEGLKDDGDFDIRRAVNGTI